MEDQRTLGEDEEQLHMTDEVEEDNQESIQQQQQQQPTDEAGEGEGDDEAEAEHLDEAAQQSSMVSAAAPPPPPPGGPPPLPDWLQRSIAGLPPSASADRSDEAAPSSAAPGPAGPADLAAMLSQRQLRATVVVEKQVVETPQDELRRALTRRMSSKAMAKKDEIADLVAKLNEGRFRTFDDLARLVQHAVRVQNEVGNIELIKVARWPLDLLNALKEVVGIIHTIRRNIKRTEDALREQANKGLVANEQAVSNIRDCVRLLRETGPSLKRATDLVVMREVSVPLHQEAALAKTNALTESCVNVVFELALSKYKQPIPRNSFNLRYRLNHTITLLQTAITLCHEAGVEAKDKRQMANQAILDMQHKYADVLQINAISSGEAFEQAPPDESSDVDTLGTPGSTASSADSPKPAPAAGASSRSTGLLHSSSGASSRFPLHSYISEGLTQKVAAYVSGLKESEGAEKVVAELAREDNRARTPMEVAILQADVRAVRELLSLCPLSASVASFFASYRNGEGNSYAHLAASLPPMASATAASAQPSLSTSSSSSSSSAAASILSALVDALSAETGFLSANLNDRGETPLHCAAKIGNADAVRFLVHQGVPLLDKDKFGRGALSLLALKCIERVTVAPPRPANDRACGLPGLSQYLLNASLADVVFNVRGTLYPAHRIILCAQSPNFKSMLENKEWKEAQNVEVRLEDMSPVAFKHLLEHLYCGDSAFVTTNLDLALDILHAADRFLVDGMKDKCQYVLFKMLTLENAFLLYTRASLHSARMLREATAHFILTHYDDIAFGDEDRSVLFDILNMCSSSS